MPHIFTEMEKSLAINLLQPRLIRDQLIDNPVIGDQVKNVQDTFTSWDKCMQSPFCKWPAIVGLVIGGIIVLSVLTCFIRCLCCGYSFCCACFSCLKCCGCGCGSCCDGKRSRSRNYEDKRSPEYNIREYVAPQPMMAGGVNTPQYAQFEPNKTTTRTVNEDALPAMPSWDTATNVHVLDDTVEEKTPEPKQVNSSVGPNVPLVTAAAATGMSSPLLPKGYDSAPFPTRSPIGFNNEYHISTESFQNRPYDNPVRSYSPSPISDAGMRGNNIRNGSASSPFVERGYGAPMQSPYGETRHATPPYIQNRFGSPVPGASAPRRDFNSPQQGQGPPMGYQPYRPQ